jgi:flagellar motor switch protein FliN/FliY
MDSSPLADTGQGAAPAGNGATRAARTDGHGKGNGNAAAGPLLPADSPLLRDLSVTLQARLGEADLTIAELLALSAGSVLSLGTRINEPVELYLNGALVGRGEIVAVEDRFGVRIVEIAAA